MSTNKLAIPRATYRLQLHAGFGFDSAAAVCAYLAELGISHVYTSPVLAAAQGSTHGYDVVDHERVNPELGGEAGLSEFERALGHAGLGWVLDIVPNHMAIHTPANRAFWSVLERGKTSPNAAMFDIDWDPPQEDLKGRVMLPVLGRELDAVIAGGEFRVAIEDGKPVLTYYNHRMPLSPESAEGIDEDAAERLNNDPDAMRALVDRQHYRPAYWKRSGTQINYRRFFSINSLIGVRVELPQVFDRVHALPLGWVREGRLDGLRIDHPDGLRDPAGYLQRLRSESGDAWLIVEKILEADETLPTGWPIDGTTGYDALNIIAGLFVNPENEDTITRAYQGFTGRAEPFEQVVQDCKRLVISQDFGGELDRLLGLLNRTGEIGADAQTLREALTDLLLYWPVYRLYPDPATREISATDKSLAKASIAAAAEQSQAAGGVWDELLSVLLLDAGGDAGLEFALRFQQLASAVMAKGVEDTAFYRYHRLTSLNEVGADPSHFGTTTQRFQSHFTRLARDWPATMIASTTHDTKRSEDARTRIAMLSQMPGRWAEAVEVFSQSAASHRADENTPSKDDEYLLYQTLVGTWPIDAERLTAYMLKSAREAKRNTSWTDQNDSYEQALTAFIQGVVKDKRLTGALESLLTDLLPAARVASLSQTLIKLTVPGVPDIYQGCELWDESLVDPDNRRPVDYAKRRTMLSDLDGMSVGDILARMDEGLPKLWLTRQVLAARRDQPDCFAPGAGFDPIAVSGKSPDAVVAYRRGKSAVVVAPHVTAGIEEWSAETSVTLPPGNWRDAITDRRVETTDGDPIAVAELCREFPVSLYLQEGAES